MPGNLAVFRLVHLKVSVHEVQVCAAYLHLPQAGVKVAAGECHGGDYPVAVLVKHGLGRNLGKILGIVVCHLIALTGDNLGKVAIAVKQAHCHQVHIHVRGFLEVVAGKDTKTAGVNLERSVKTVLHAEICH